MSRLVFVLGLVVPLTACGTPTPLSIASLVLDVGSYAVTGKTTTDHAFSAVAGEDCAVIRVLEGDPCTSLDDYQLALAVLEPLAEEGVEVRSAASADLLRRQTATVGIEDVGPVASFAQEIFLSDDLAPGAQALSAASADIVQVGHAGFISDDLWPDRGA
ncbi:hypothetical protein [Algihabitans albus]|uniref:hypothetical protein n=1 Tax=Algihabitans albus TaxID=2164067 RepID=UPI000E5D967D|nr:hypothetical protein [Algihabitans albus]